MKVCLGFDLNCFTNRYIEPEAWTSFVASCGVKVVQFNFDIIDFLLPWKIQERLVNRTLACCKDHGIRIKCAFGGHNHHQNYLGHPDNKVVRVYEMFYKRMADLTAALEAEGFGTCFAITTVSTQNNVQLREDIINRVLESYHRIALYAKQVGLKYLLYETTSVPRETGATFEENDRILRELKDMAIPMHLCLDVGHRNQEHPSSMEADPYKWIKRYAKVSKVIHIQQCNSTGSHHWPFTSKYNQVGDITPERVLEAINYSGAEQEILLALEVRHRAYFPDEYQLENNLRASIEYWRKWIIS